MRKATTAVLLTVALAGCVGPITTSPSPTATETPTAEPPTQEAVNYTVDYKCKDHIAVSGDHIQNCSAKINVIDLNGAEYVEIKSTDIISYKSRNWIVPEGGEKLVGLVWVDKDGTNELRYGDRVIVTAVYPDGRQKVLERHEFSCSDVFYANACEQSAEERAS